MNPLPVAITSFLLLDGTLNADQKTIVALKGVEWLKWASLAPFVFLAIACIALFSFLAVSAWSGARSAEREAYYKNDMLKKLAESSEAGAAATLEYLREQEKQAARKRRSGLQLGGLVTAAVGVGIMIFLWAMVKHPPVYLVGLIPLLIGIALVAYAQLFAPKE